MKYPDTIQNLIECFSKYPSIGKKTAERIALATLELDENVLSLLRKSLNDVEKIHKCKICNNITENDICSICSNSKRNKKMLCVVSSVKDIISIEKNNIYNGYYYILPTLISVNNGFDVEKLGLKRITNIIDNNDTEEVILALKSNIEGETTSMYLSKLLKNKNIVISKIALGIPMDVEIDYVDALTLESAIANRTIINDI